MCPVSASCCLPGTWIRKAWSQQKRVNGLGVAASLQQHSLGSNSSSFLGSSFINREMTNIQQRSAGSSSLGLAAARVPVRITHPHHQYSFKSHSCALYLQGANFLCQPFPSGIRTQKQAGYLKAVLLAWCWTLSLQVCRSLYDFKVTILSSLLFQLLSNLVFTLASL